MKFKTLADAFSTQLNSTQPKLLFYFGIATDQSLKVYSILASEIHTLSVDWELSGRPMARGSTLPFLKHRDKSHQPARIVAC